MVLAARRTYLFGMESRRQLSELSSRREELAARIRVETGIDDVMVSALVETFYDQVRQDDLLGPVFDERILEWPAHLDQMKRFWSSVALMTGIYHGRPMPKHLPLPIDARHFDRWLEIFRRTAREVCPPAAADHFIDKAARIAESLELGIAGANGVLLGKGERYQAPG